jgi:hypothetical protein
MGIRRRIMEYEKHSLVIGGSVQQNEAIEKFTLEALWKRMQELEAENEATKIKQKELEAKVSETQNKLKLTQQRVIVLEQGMVAIGNIVDIHIKGISQKNLDELHEVIENITIAANANENLMSTRIYCLDNKIHMTKRIAISFGKFMSKRARALKMKRFTAFGNRTGDNVLMLEKADWYSIVNSQAFSDFCMKKGIPLPTDVAKIQINLLKPHKFKDI